MPPKLNDTWTMEKKLSMHRLVECEEINRMESIIKIGDHSRNYLHEIMKNQTDDYGYRFPRL